MMYEYECCVVWNKTAIPYENDASRHIRPGEMLNRTNGCRFRHGKKKPDGRKKNGLTCGRTKSGVPLRFVRRLRGPSGPLLKA